MSKPKSVTLDASALEAKVNEVKVLDEKIAKVKGSASARKNKATETVNAMLVKALDPETKLADDVTIGEAIEAIEAMLTEAKSARDLLVADVLKQGQTGDAIAALVEKRSALVTEAEALGTVLKSLGIVKDVPTFAKVRSTLGGSSSSSGAKSLKGQWYRHDGDEKSPLAESNNSVGGVAWYWFGKCGADAVKSALAAEGITALASSFGPVTLTIGDKTATVSFEVTEAPKAE